MFNFNNQNNENPKDILFSDSIQKRKEDEEENNKKSKLLNILGDKATPTDVLYGTSTKLEQKIKNLGLHKNEEVIAGAASSVNMTPIEELNAKKEDKNNMTPVEELYKRQKGYSEIWEGDENFKSAMVRMFGREKGYVNNKYDLGGETNLGITKNTLNDYKKKHSEFKDVDIKKISKDQAARIYYDEYWKKSGADKIKDKDLAYVHFDASVNHGLGNARQFLKESGGDFDKYIEIRKKFYSRFIKNNPEQKRHENGWANRLKELEENRGNLF